MAIFYCPQKLAFFDDRIGAPPAGARPVDDDRHRALMEAQGEGKRIVPDADGTPIALDPAAPSPDQLWETLRRRRDRLLTQSDWTQMPDSPLSPELRALWAAYRQALRDLPEATTDPAAPVWPPAPQGDAQ